MTASMIISIVSIVLSVIALAISIRSIYMSTVLMGSFNRLQEKLLELLDKLNKAVG